MNNHIDNSLGANYLQRKPWTHVFRLSHFSGWLSANAWWNSSSSRLLRSCGRLSAIISPCQKHVWMSCGTCQKPIETRETIHTFPDMFIEMAGPFTITFIWSTWHRVTGTPTAWQVSTVAKTPGKLWRAMVQVQALGLCPSHDVGFSSTELWAWNQGEVIWK